MRGEQILTAPTQGVNHRAMKLLPILLVLALAGCSTLSDMGDGLDLPSFDWAGGARTTTIPQGECPPVSRVAELAALYQFTDPTRPSADQKMGESQLTRVESRCKKQGGDLKLDVALVFEHALGPQGRARAGDKPTFSVPYFVAVVDTGGQILAKDIYIVTFTYGSEDTRQLQTENVTLSVPLPRGVSPRSLRSLIGFQLSNDELTYNRTLPDDQLGRSVGVMGER